MPHVVLLGDSIFDNAAYVGGGPDVATQLSEALPGGWRVTLCAVDGSVIDGVPRQLARVPADATHLVLSVGGNDALGHVDILDQPARSSAEVLDRLAHVADRFHDRYRAMLRQVLDTGLPLAVCTIYNGWLPDADSRRRARVALTVFNDAILRAGLLAGVPVLELREVCSDPEDYANPIEPSVRGGGRIADAIRRALVDEALESRQSRIIA